MTVVRPFDSFIAANLKGHGAGRIVSAVLEKPTVSPLLLIQ